MVPLAGLEPARPKRAADFESAASTNFTTGAHNMPIEIHNLFTEVKI